MKAVHCEIRQKAAFDWPFAVAAVVLQIKGSTVESSRVVIGHVAPVPWRSREAEQALNGKSLNDDTARAAAEAALKSAKSLSRNAYKVQLARVAIKRALLKSASEGAT